MRRLLPATLTVAMLAAAAPALGRGTGLRDATIAGRVLACGGYGATCFSNIGGISIFKGHQLVARKRSDRHGHFRFQPHPAATRSTCRAPHMRGRDRLR